MTNDPARDPKGDEERLKEFYRTSDEYLQKNLASHGKEYFALYIERVCRYVPKGAHVLDLGCGTGVSCVLLAERGFKVTGVDISDKFLDKNLTGECVQLVAADAKALPFPDGSFDAVTSYEFMEHVFGVEGVLDEMIRVVKPGGLILVLSPNLLSPFLPLKNAIGLIRGRRPIGVAGETIGAALRMVFGNALISVSKLASKGVSFRYRDPDLTRPGEADADSVYLANQVDIRRYLRGKGFALVGGSEGHSPFGEVIAHLFPWMCGECCVVAKKGSGST